YRHYGLSIGPMSLYAWCRLSAGNAYMYSESPYILTSLASTWGTCSLAKQSSSYTNKSLRHPMPYHAALCLCIKCCHHINKRLVEPSNTSIPCLLNTFLYGRLLFSCEITYHIVDNGKRCIKTIIF